MSRPWVMAMLVVTVFGPATMTSMPAAQPRVNQPAAANDQAPDVAWKAYTEALRIQNADQKREALQKVVQEHPGSTAAKQALYQLVILQVGNARQADAKALEQVKQYLNEYPADTGANQYVAVATLLLNQGVLLDEAERIAAQALAFDEQRFVARMRQEFVQLAADEGTANPQAKPLVVPDDEALAAQYASLRARALLTLGQIQVKRGKTAEGEKALREAYLTHSRTYAGVTAAVKLAELAKAAGRDQEQMEYLTVAALGGRLTPEIRTELETLYRRMHGGTMEGFEEMLDARYEKEIPKIDAVRYVPTASRSDRVVLAEVFTGAACSPCVNTDLAFDAALARYTTRELAVLMYHVHVPRPDPMANPSTVARAQFYKLEGVPNAFIDGVADDPDPTGAQSLASIYGRALQPSIEKRLTTKADVTLGLEANAVGDAVTVKISVGKARTARQHLRLHIALAEKRVRYSGENGVRYHAMVVRSLAGEAGDGFPLPPGKRATVTHRFELAAIVAQAKAHLDQLEAGDERFAPFRFSAKKHEIDRGQLVVVAFVQDDDTREVLQAASLAPTRQPPRERPASGR